MSFCDRCGWMCLEPLPTQGHLHRWGGWLSVPVLTRVARDVVPIRCRRMSGQPLFECHFLQKRDWRLLLQVHWGVDGQKLWDKLVSVFCYCWWCFWCFDVAIDENLLWCIWTDIDDCHGQCFNGGTCVVSLNFELVHPITYCKFEYSWSPTPIVERVICPFYEFIILCSQKVWMNHLCGHNPIASESFINFQKTIKHCELLWIHRTWWMASSACAMQDSKACCVRSKWRSVRVDHARTGDRALNWKTPTNANVPSALVELTARFVTSSPYGRPSPKRYHMIGCFDGILIFMLLTLTYCLQIWLSAHITYLCLDFKHSSLIMH